MPIGNIPVPAPHIEDEPTVSVCINREWANTLIGQIWDLRYPEAWGGTLEENRRARGEIKNLIDMLMRVESCGEMAFCCEPNTYIYRISPDTGRLERSLDTGTTWTPDPKDPIFTIQQQPPIVGATTDHTKCDAATNFKEHFIDLIAGCSENLGTAVTIVQLAGGVAALLIDIMIIIVTEGAGLALITTITGAIFTGITAAFTEGKAAFDAYWTEERKDQILCAAYCTIGDNGQWTQDQWDDFRARAKLDLTPGAARDMVLTSVNAGGYVGANNMASYGNAADADCSSCPCSPCITSWQWATVFQDLPEDYVKTETYIEASAVLSGPWYYWVIWSPVGHCCDLTVTSIEALDPATTAFCAKMPCDAGTYPTDWNFGDEANDWVNDAFALPHGEMQAVKIRASYPFIARATFA